MAERDAMWRLTGFAALVFAGAHAQWVCSFVFVTCPQLRLVSMLPADELVLK